MYGQRERGWDGYQPVADPLFASVCTIIIVPDPGTAPSERVFQIEQYTKTIESS